MTALSWLTVALLLVASIAITITCILLRQVDRITRAAETEAAAVGATYQLGREVERLASHVGVDHCAASASTREVDGRTLWLEVRLPDNRHPGPESEQP